MTKEKMLIRQYRISKDDDKLVKEKSKKFGVGEAEYVRRLIRQGIIIK